jgi:hypothetical protein
VDLNNYDNISDMFVLTTAFIDGIDLSLDLSTLMNKFPFLRPNAYAIAIGRIDGKAILGQNTENPDDIFCTAINLVCFFDEGK